MFLSLKQEERIQGIIKIIEHLFIFLSLWNKACVWECCSRCTETWGYGKLFYNKFCVMEEKVFKKFLAFFMEGEDLRVKEGRMIPQELYELHNTWCKSCHPVQSARSGPLYTTGCRVPWHLSRGNNVRKFGTKAHLLRAGAAVPCTRHGRLRAFSIWASRLATLLSLAGSFRYLASESTKCGLSITGPTELLEAT